MGKRFAISSYALADARSADEATAAAAAEVADDNDDADVDPDEADDNGDDGADDDSAMSDGDVAQDGFIEVEEDVDDELSSGGGAPRSGPRAVRSPAGNGGRSGLTAMARCCEGPRWRSLA